MSIIHQHNSTTRFSDRANIYAAYRPAYPLAMLRYLEENQMLKLSQSIADIGAGTGIFSKLLAENGYTVHCVEPNKEMREEGMRFLRDYPKCIWFDGSAESTTLESGSVDIVTCAQSFHWFEPNGARKEFIRIAKSNAAVLLVWNSRKMLENDFMVQYNALIKRFATDHAKTSEVHADENVITAFYTKKPIKATFENNQLLTCQAFLGRVFSSSYMPYEGSPDYPHAKEAFIALFEACSRDGLVTVPYETRVYYGNLNNPN